MKPTLIIHDEHGNTAKIVASSLSAWAAQGWSVTEADEPAAAELNTSTGLRKREPRKQSSDVTAPGESIVGGAHAPLGVATAQDEE